MKRLTAAVLCLAVAACTHSSTVKPKPIEGVKEYPGLAHTHVPGKVDYPQTPPVGGPHNPVWLRCGVYTEPLPNVHAVHSMEHGAVWITYRPSVTGGDLDTLHRLQALKPAYVLISPYDGLPSLVVASAWGLQLTADKVDDPRLAAFVKQYAGGPQGGEGPSVRCDNGATLDQVKRLDAGQPVTAPTTSAPAS
jgi:hypothetical protein